LFQHFSEIPAYVGVRKRKGYKKVRSKENGRKQKGPKVLPYPKRFTSCWENTLQQTEKDGRNENPFPNYGTGDFRSEKKKSTAILGVGSKRKSN